MAIKTPVINKQLDDITAALSIIAGKSMSEYADMAEIGRIVRAGLASKFFNIGDQLMIKWRDTADNKEYDVPLDIVHIGDTTLSDGEVVPGMYLQWHYCTPFGVQFDNAESLYVSSNELAAGTYYFTAKNGWGKIVANTSYKFTLTKAVPANGHLVLPVGAEGSDPTSWKVTTYASASSTTAIESVSITIGADGTYLGDWSTSTLYGTTGMNNMHRCAYGYNRWSQSGVRQYLNSSKAKGAWWTAQNPYDRAPDQLYTKNGFLTGFDDEFLAQLKETKVTTLLNTVSDSAIGTSEDTYDLFYLPSKRNMNLLEEVNGVEGDIFDYWYRATNGVKPANWKDGAAPITYGVDNHNSAQHVRLRSAGRGYAYHTWSVYSNGHVSSIYATYAYRFSPLCVIC